MTKLGGTTTSTTTKRRVGGRLAVVGALLAVAAAGPGAMRGLAAGAVTIWPINPVIAAGAEATALWLQNDSNEPLTLQIRVLRWTQEGYAEQLEDAAGLVVASPPVANIAPRRRQLVRIVSTAPVPPDRELAFRVLVDELPAIRDEARSSVPPRTAGLGVAFRMRYSLPLFVYGRGLAHDGNASRQEPAPLVWRSDHAAGPSLILRNDGPIHARVSKVRLVSARRSVDIATGLLGYVLPGAEMRWQLPSDVQVADEDVLELVVNGRPAALARF